MARIRSFSLEAAGWGFWAIGIVVLAPPSIYAAFQLVQKHLSATVPVTLGILFSMVASAVVTWIVNSVIQSGHARKKALARKQGKRKK